MQGAIYSQRSAPRVLAILAWFVVVALVLSACGTQQTPKVYRIGVLSGLEFVADITDSFKAGMTELGYIEGQNVVYDVQRTNVDIEAYRRILQEFVANDVDLIFVFPTEPSLEARAATAGTNIPVVFAFSQVEGVDLINSIREPGGNITGVRIPGPEVAVKRFEIMHEIAPTAQRMLVPYLAGYPIVPPQLEALRPVAAATGVTLVEMPAASPAELEAALNAQVTGSDPGVDAILQIVEPVAVTAETFVVLSEFASQYGLPIGGATMSVDGHESLFGLNVDNGDTGRQAALLVDKILKGTPAGTVPVVSPQVVLQVNYRAAQNSGVTLPKGLLSQANEIIR